MDFVELNRSFVRIEKDRETSLNAGRVWGHKIGGWLDWSDLRNLRRVVLLAEASSGKSAEFRNQKDQLCAQGNAAFFVTLEELADHPFEAALDPADLQAFEAWIKGTADGWFFLDSLDEARLNRKSFEGALKRLARALGASLERARILVSCRVTDWRGAEDRAFIERLLPAWELPKKAHDETNPLLDPIFKKKQSFTRPAVETKPNPRELVVVRLAPLSREQCRTLGEHFGVINGEDFVDRIGKQGLEAFAERPGDVIDLASYWTKFGRFGAFAEMAEHGVGMKLAERDPFRPDNDALSPQEAREGVERLAAALTLGKSFTLHAPGYNGDPSLAAGAIDPAAILDDWPDAKRNALLRRGVFAPATHGRIRFHHRSTQEYLTARWLDRLWCADAAKQDVWDLVFANRYAVDTVVPSLRPAAAWLALWHSEFCDETITREPLVLVRHGDPGSLPIEARGALLKVFAQKQAKGDIADDQMDNRALWMFADPKLAPAIRQAWRSNPSSDFRFDLARLIREGSITECADLARELALDRTAGDYHRVVAMDALAAWDDKKTLAVVAAELVANAAQYRPRFLVEAAKVLFPAHLAVPQLFTLVDTARRPKAHSGDGFGYAIFDLYEACPNEEMRKDFVARLAAICLSQPFAESYQRISARHQELAKHLVPIAKREVKELSQGDPPESLIWLLMAVERGEREYHTDGERPSLLELVNARPKVKRALFWADVAEQRAHGGRDNDPTTYWAVMVFGASLWQFNEADLSWLEHDLATRTDEGDQRIAFSAIFNVLSRAEKVDAERARLQAAIVRKPHLEADMAAYLARPPRPSAEMRRLDARMAKGRRKHEENEIKAKASWQDFEQKLRADPGQLRDPAQVASWKAGAYRLWHLTHWLAGRAESTDAAAPPQWRLLEEGFGRQVAEAYRDGLKLQWRAEKPARPKRKPSGVVTIKYPNILAFGAIGCEAAEDSEWSSGLSDDEARRAALHGCLTEQGYPEWIDALVDTHPRIVLPLLRRAVREEYLAPSAAKSDFHALRRMADDPKFSSRAIRFRELSRGKAERDAEPPAWSPSEVLTFERERTAPAKTGADLLRVVLAVLRDIQFVLHKGDASSRKLLQRAENEDEVQNWLAEQLMLRAKGRYRAFREAEVALGDKPDVIVASSAATCEVAIEVKHSKNWTVRQLEDALRTQLAEDYLKPEARRQGVLVITHHATRQWRDTETNDLITFDHLIQRLESIAASLQRNAVGVIAVRCAGIDATPASA
jgi:hypothetical protein